MSEPRIVVLTAPSGAGKSTIARHVMDQIPEMRFSVSATTRQARPAEADGTHYHFLPEDDFRARIRSGELLEYEEVYPGTLYGTLRSEVDRSSRDKPVLLDIDVRGARSVKREFGDDALVIFIMPPSFEELAVRLRGRGTEEDDVVKTRLARARKELERAHDFDALVVNDRLDKAVRETSAMIREFLKS